MTNSVSFVSLLNGEPSKLDNTECPLFNICNTSLTKERFLHKYAKVILDIEYLLLCLNVKLLKYLKNKNEPILL